MKDCSLFVVGRICSYLPDGSTSSKAKGGLRMLKWLVSKHDNSGQKRLSGENSMVPWVS